MMLNSSLSTPLGVHICKSGQHILSARLEFGHRCGAARRPSLQQQQQPQKADRELHAKTPAAETGASEGLGKASPDILRLFSETQRNLLELNRSRLSALDELRIAKTKISDLEGQLEQATTDSSHAAAASILQNSERKEPPQSLDSQQAVAPSIITVVYETGWTRVMMHYSADGQTWTDLPGVEMQQGKEAFAGSKVVQIRGNRLEFVLNDGAGQWDTPDPYGGSQTKNYTINAAGQYRLEAGQVSQIE